MSDTGRYNLNAFIDLVVKRAGEVWPDNQGTRVEGRNVIVSRPAGEGDERLEISVHLARAYREYWQSGDLAGVLQKVFGPFSEPAPTRELIAEKAMLKFDLAKINRDRERLHWPFAANPELIIPGVLDFPGSMRYFDEGGEQPELERYGVTKAEFWAWGMEHLCALVLTERFTPQHLDFNGTEWNGHELWIVSNGSGYASAVLLCPDIIDTWLPKTLRGKWVAGIPDRDTLIITREDTPPELLASAMANGRRLGLYPFDWTLYTIRNGQIVNYWGTLSDSKLRTDPRFTDLR